MSNAVFSIERCSANKTRVPANTYTTSILIPSIHIASILNPTSHPITHTTPASTTVQHGNSIKLPIFKGVGNEYSDKFWFIAKAVWEDQAITDDQMNKSMLVSAFQDHALMWCIKYSTNNLMSELDDI